MALSLSVLISMVLVPLIVIGLLYWIIVYVIPSPAPVKMVANIVCAVAGVLILIRWLLTLA